MFHYLSGFVSDLDLDQDAEVYVYLLFPQKYARYLKTNIFDQFRECDKSPHRTNYNCSFQDGRGSVWDHYIPLSVPFKAHFSRDCGVSPLKEELDVFIIDWLENNFNVDLDSFLGELSSEYHENPEDGITRDNLFNYISVAFEHVSFVNKVVDVVLKDPYFNKSFHTYEALHEYHNVSLTQNLIIGKNLSFISEKYDPIDLIMDCEGIEKDCGDDAKTIAPSTLNLAALSYFMRSTNKIFKPCNLGNQRSSKKYIELMNEARLETNEILFKDYTFDEEE